MDKFLIRKDVYDELIEKGYGKRDLSKLTKKQITDKNGHKRTVYVKNGEQPVTQKQTKTDELTPEKKARYEDMLEKVKAGPEENALFVRDKGMLNKKDAIAHLEGKLNSSRSQQKEKATESKASKAEEKKESEANSKEDVKANLYKKVEFTPKEMKAIREEAKRINYKPGMENSLIIALKNRNDGTSGSLYFKNREIWNKTGMVKDTNSDYDLIKKKIKSMNGNFGSDDSNSKFDEEMETTKPQINNYEDAHKYLTKLKPSSSELKNDFEDHRDIVLKRIERGQNFEDAIKTYEKEMKTSVPHMVESGIMSFEEGNNYIKAWEDLKKQI